MVMGINLLRQLFINYDQSHLWSLLIAKSLCSSDFFSPLNNNFIIIIINYKLVCVYYQRLRFTMTISLLCWSMYIWKNLKWKQKHHWYESHTPFKLRKVTKERWRIEEGKRTWETKGRKLTVVNRQHNYNQPK